MTLNVDLIQARFEDIRQSVERVERMQELSRAAFLADQDTLDVACHRLLVAIEAALQMCVDISAQRLQRVPEAYAQCFAQLGEAGILSPDLSARLQRMARFRNMLVHVYWDIDYDQVYDLLQSHLDDLTQFARAVGNPWSRRTLPRNAAGRVGSQVADWGSHCCETQTRAVFESIREEHALSRPHRPAEWVRTT